MRFKLTIEKYDEERVLVYDSTGLSDAAVNSINQYCKRWMMHDVKFAELDDGRVGIVCKPKTWMDIMRWNENRTHKKYPKGFFEEFERKCYSVIKEEMDIEKYVEKLTKEEIEMKKKLQEDIVTVREENDKYGVDEQRSKEDESWNKEQEDL